jgi:hypothetical protein
VQFIRCKFANISLKIGHTYTAKEKLSGQEDERQATVPFLVQLSASNS